MIIVSRRPSRQQRYSDILSIIDAILGGMRAAICVNGLCVHLGNAPVLNDITLEINRGQITGLLGPSGAGKTTLLRVLAGLQTETSGSAHLLKQPAGSPDLQSRLGYMTQSPAIYPDLTVWENIRYFSIIAGAKPNNAQAILTAVELQELAGRPAGRLSGGQRTRVSLAMALVGDPDILLLDEPTVGLDPLLRQKLWHYFHQLAAQGKTVLVSSHVMDEAENCDQLILLREGRVLAADTPDNLRHSSAQTAMNDVFISLITQEAR